MERVDLMPASTAVIDRGVLTGSDLKARLAIIHDVMNSVMVVDVDYGKIPGTDKPTLFKPGAEKLNLTFQFAAEDPQIEDLSTSDEVRYRLRVPIHGASGRLLAMGVGECSSNEEKYRWRRPVCDEEFAETPAEHRREKWYRGKEGKANWKGKQIRTSPADVANTVLKMAHKRGYIHGTLMATGASWLFNQDLEDLQVELRESLVGDDEKKPETKQPQRRSQTGSPKTTETQGPGTDTKIATGLVEKVWRPKDKKYFAIKLKDDDRLFTQWIDKGEQLETDAKGFAGIDHRVKLAYVEAPKDGKVYFNAVGIAIADAEPTAPAQTDKPATKGAPQQRPLVAGDIFGGREPGAEG